MGIEKKNTMNRRSSFLKSKKCHYSIYATLLLVSLLQLNKFQLNNIDALLRTNTKASKKNTESSNPIKIADDRTLNTLENDTITKIAVLGERHSGTTWIYDHLKECFEPHLKINRRLTRYKHWFQYDDGLPHDTTLVLSLFRNPYHWTEAMRKIPHHASNHLHLNWTEFVTKPWTMERVGFDLNITDYNSRICQEKFKYNEVISCNKYPYPKGYFKKRPDYSAHQPFYELHVDGSGIPYNNILELRTAKIVNFINVIPKIHYVSDFWTFQYEKLLLNGTAQLLRDIENVTGVKANCRASPPSFRKGRVLDNEFVVWINEHLDWDVERLIGYSKLNVDALSTQ